MSELTNVASSLAIKYRTGNLPFHSRREWLREMISKEYTKVEVSAPSNVQLLDETTIYPWQQLRLSTVRSHGIKIDRLKMEPYSSSHDNYLAVLLLSGRYMLEQNGRQVFLQPGEMTIYDATKPHRIHCPEDFAKVIISVPRKYMRERLSGVESCTACKISNKSGVGLVTSNLIRSISEQLNEIDIESFNRLSEHTLDFLTMSFAAISPQNYTLSRNGLLTLSQIKLYVEQHLTDIGLSPKKVAEAVNLSQRYINMLFETENTSLMRYVLSRRLQRCYDDLIEPSQQYRRVSDIAFKWGFNDVSHFSRAFRQAFDTAPTKVLNRIQ